MGHEWALVRPLFNPHRPCLQHLLLHLLLDTLVQCRHHHLLLLPRRVVAAGEGAVVVATGA